MFFYQLADNDSMKAALRRDTEPAHSPNRHDKKTTDPHKTSNRARTVTLSHAQERQNAKSRAVYIAPVIKRPVIQPDPISMRNNKTPMIER